MAELVAEKCRNVIVSDFEMDLPSPSFTYHTLIKLKDRYPDCSFKIIIGSDNWIEFRQWKNYDKIISEFGVIVFARPGFHLSPIENIEGVVLLENTPQCYVSSTIIREMAREGKNINFLVPENVADYITKNKLYRKDEYK